MYNLTKKSANQFQWTDECDTFLCLKALLTSAPVLVYPDFSKSFMVHIDASNGAVGEFYLKFVMEKSIRLLTVVEH